MNHLATSADFDLAYVQYNHVLLRRVSHLGCTRQEVEDYTQQAWLHAWRKAGTFRAESSPLSYLTRIAFNLVFQDRRKKKIIFPLPSVESESGSALTFDAADPTTPDLDRKIYLEQLLARLPRKEALFLVKFYMLQVPVAELASNTGRSQNTIKTLTYRSIRKLRRRMSEGSSIQ